VGFDHDAGILAALFNRAHVTKFFDDSSEHAVICDCRFSNQRSHQVNYQEDEEPDS
jgi:hypothetical protein